MALMRLATKNAVGGSPGFARSTVAIGCPATILGRRARRQPAGIDPDTRLGHACAVAPQSPACRVRVRSKAQVPDPTMAQSHQVLDRHAAAALVVHDHGTLHVRGPAIDEDHGEVAAALLLATRALSTDRKATIRPSSRPSPMSRS